MNHVLNYKVATLLGYKWKKNGWWIAWLWGSHLTIKPDGQVWCGFRVPNFSGDLNLCGEFERQLGLGPQAMTYLNNLEIVTSTCGATISRWRFATATAEQRCEAFIKTVHP